MVLIVKQSVASAAQVAQGQRYTYEQIREGTGQGRRKRPWERYVTPMKSSLEVGSIVFEILEGKLLKLSRRVNLEASKRTEVVQGQNACQ